MNAVTPIRPGRLLLNHLARSVSLAADRHRDPRDERLVRSAQAVSWLCRKAQPFLLPPDGDFGLSGARSFKVGEARLPYPVIALEFSGDKLVTRQNAKVNTLVMFLFDRGLEQFRTTGGGGIGIISAGHGPGKACCDGWSWDHHFITYEQTVTVSISDAGSVTWAGGDVFAHDIAPGALGVVEWGWVGMFHLFNVGPEVATQYAVSSRLFAVGALILINVAHGILLVAYWGIKRAGRVEPRIDTNPHE